jgi:hypothetical protein
MDGQRAPQKTRRIAPSGPVHHDSANDWRPRADRSSSPDNVREDSPDRRGSRNGHGARHGSRNGSRNGAQRPPNGRRNSLRAFGDRVRDFTGQLPLVGRATGFRRRQRHIDDGWRRAEYDAGKADRDRGPADGFDVGPDAGGRLNDVPGRLPADMADGGPSGFADDFGGGLADGYAGDPGLDDEGPSWAAGGGSRGGRHARNHGGSGGKIRIPLTARNVSIKAVVVLALLSVIVGFCCTQSTLTMLDVVSSALDAKAQVTAIEALAKNGNLVNVDHLKEMETRLTALDGDLARIQSALPGPVVNTSAGTSLNNTLTMAHYLVQAGRYGVDAALLLVPNLKGALTDIGNSAGNPTVPPAVTPGASPAPKPTATAAATATAPPAPVGGLTMEDVQRAQNDITLAGVLAQKALAERQSINDQQLSRIGLGSVVSILHKMDALAPQLPKYLGYADQILPALPDLLGVTKPAHFLLFDIDSDEMRATGGFMGNYALITVQNGKLIGGVHLQDTFRFDCPGGIDRCQKAGPPIPPQYAWMNAFPQSFRMRDSNISPDFPTSAKLIMQKYQEESGQSVDGVIMITPEIIKDILKVTGSLTISGVNEKVTAADLQDVIHYSHILNRNNFTGDKKAIDAALGSALLHKVGALSAQQQSALMKSILAGFGTKDVQVYFNDPRVEGLVEQFHVASAIPMPPGQDGLMVTDNTVGATYYNRDMEEKVTDTITFDSQGNAIHDMTMTYVLPAINHSWTPIYVDDNGNKLTWYSGVTRILVPDGSVPINPYYFGDGVTSAMQIVECNITANQQNPGCVQTEAPEPNHVVWAVRFNNMQVGTDSVTLRMQWTTPNVLKKASDGSLQYNLQIYKQAGSHIAYDITIVPPKGQTIAQPIKDPLRTPKGVTPGMSVQFTSPSLIADTLLTVTFTGK